MGGREGKKAIREWHLGLAIPGPFRRLSAALNRRAMGIVRPLGEKGED